MEKNQSFLVEEVLPQITDVTRPMCEPVSWMIEGDLGQSVESLCEGTARVPTVRFDVGQLMQWPDINSAGVMICGFMLESEMPSLGYMRRTAEPVSVVTKSEMLTPVFAGGSLLRQPPWLWWRQLHREFLSCLRSEVISEPVCLWPLAGQTSCF